VEEEEERLELTLDSHDPLADDEEAGP